MMVKDNDLTTESEIHNVRDLENELQNTDVIQEENRM